jgi:hypothetical protein
MVNDEVKNYGANEILKHSVPYSVSDTGEELTRVLDQIKEDAAKLKTAMTEFSQQITLSLSFLGFYRRMFAIRNGEDIKCCVNSHVIERSGAQIVEQEDESGSHIKYIHLRPAKILITYINEDGDTELMEASGVNAAEVLKQVELAEGIPLSALGRPIRNWDAKSEASKINIIKNYLKELSKMETAIENELEADMELKTARHAYLARQESIKAEIKNAYRDTRKQEALHEYDIKRGQRKKHKFPWD